MKHPLKRDCKGQAALCRGCRGVPCFFSLLRAACGGTQERKKEFFRGPLHTVPQIAFPEPLHPRFLERLTEKFGMTHVEKVRLT